MRCKICDRKVDYAEFLMNKGECDYCTYLSDEEKNQILEKRKDPTFDVTTLWKESENVEYEEKDEKEENDHSLYISITKFMAVLFLILCCIGGIFIGIEYNLFLMIACWMGSFCGFSIVYGIACIVENTTQKK